MSLFIGESPRDRDLRGEIEGGGTEGNEQKEEGRGERELVFSFHPFCSAGKREKKIGRQRRKGNKERAFAPSLCRDRCQCAM